MVAMQPKRLTVRTAPSLTILLGKFLSASQATGISPTFTKQSIPMKQQGS